MESNQFESTVDTTSDSSNDTMVNNKNMMSEVNKKRKVRSCSFEGNDENLNDDGFNLDTPDSRNTISSSNVCIKINIST